MEFVEEILNLEKPPKKVKFEQRIAMGERYKVVVFNDMFSCKVLSNRGGVLTVEHFATSIAPEDAIYAMCDCFNELAKDYGVRRIEIALNQVDITVTARSAKRPDKMYQYWEDKMA